MSLDADVKGDAYEGLLEKNAQDTKSGAGQYFTPRALIRAIVDVMQPGPDETICDPACGTGGFLLAAHDYVSKHHKLDQDQKKHLRLDALRGLGDRRRDGAALRDEPCPARHRTGTRPPSQSTTRCAPTPASGSRWCSRTRRSAGSRASPS